MPVLINALLNSMAMLEPVAAIFSPSGPFVIDAVGLVSGEYISLFKLNSDGFYREVVDNNGPIRLSDQPNIILIDVPGSYKLVKLQFCSNTIITAGYEEL